MSSKRQKHWLTEEIADFLAKCPSAEELISYHPSAVAQKRLRELLEKSESGHTTTEEQWELDQFEHAEMLIQMIKARLRSRKAVRG